MELHRIHSHFILSFTVFWARSIEQDQRLYLLIAKVPFKIDLFLSCVILLRELLLFWRRFRQCKVLLALSHGLCLSFLHLPERKQSFYHRVLCRRRGHEDRY